MKNKESILELITEGDLESLNKLVEYYYPYIEKYVETNYFGVGIEKEELIGVGLLGLSNLINEYNLGNISDFFSEIKNYVYKEIDKFVKDDLKYKETISFDDLKNEESNVLDKYDDEQRIKLINDIMESMPIKLRRVLKLVFYYNYSYNKAGQILHVSGSRVGQLIDNAIAYIKKEIRLKEIKYYYSNDEKNNPRSELNETNPIMSKEMGYSYMKSNFKEYDIGEITDVFLKLPECFFDDFVVKTDDKLALLKKMLEQEKVYRLGSIYKYFSEYTREQVDQIVNLLPKLDKKIIKLKYNDLSVMDLDITPIDGLISDIVLKIKEIFKDRDYLKILRLNTIYLYFLDYSEEEIDLCISKLDEREQILCELIGKELSKDKQSWYVQLKIIVSKLEVLLIENSKKERQMVIKK